MIGSTAATRLTRALLAAQLVAASISGCGSPHRAPSASGEGVITVFTAQALQVAFTRIGDEFHTYNPFSSVQFTFGFSPYLVTQLTQGASGDVFAAGNTNDMDQVARAGLLAGAPVAFASNTLAIVVAPGNPKKVASFGDLNRPDLKVAVCATQVQEPGAGSAAGLPCGVALDKVEQASGVRLAHATEVNRSEDVLQKVIDRDVDAGVVYASDATAGGASLTRVPFPEAAGVVVTYPIAVLKGSKNPELARKFIDMVTSQPGQAILDDCGFAAP